MIDWKLQQMVKASGWPLDPACLAPGADFNARVDGGLVPLVWACQHGKAGLVAHMIKHGARVDAPAEDGRSLLELALASASFQVVMMLIDELKAAGVPPPDEALRQMLTQTFRKGHPNSKNRLLQTLRDWDRLHRKTSPVDVRSAGIPGAGRG